MANKSTRSAETNLLLRDYYQDWFIGADRLPDATPFDKLDARQLDVLAGSFEFERYRLSRATDNFTDEFKRTISETWLAKKLRILLTK